MSSHYEVLGVAPEADDATVRRAYVALARRHHPDVTGGDAARMRALNEAFAVLGDPVRRARYDRAMAKPTARPPWEGGTDSDDADHLYEADDLAADLADDRPVHVVDVPRWVSLIPVTLLAAAAATFVLGVQLSSRSLVGLAMVELLLSFLFFLAAPFIALLASRSRGRARGPST
ncbi:MAG: J domain-containing protein [Actinomycetota bacterium]